MGASRCKSACPSATHTHNTQHTHIHTHTHTCTHARAQHNPQSHSTVTNTKPETVERLCFSKDAENHLEIPQALRLAVIDVHRVCLTDAIKAKGVVARKKQIPLITTEIFIADRTGKVC